MILLNIKFDLIIIFFSGRLQFRVTRRFCLSFQQMLRAQLITCFAILKTAHSKRQTGYTSLPVCPLLRLLNQFVPVSQVCWWPIAKKCIPCRITLIFRALASRSLASR